MSGYRSTVESAPSTSEQLARKRAADEDHAILTAARLSGVAYEPRPPPCGLAPILARLDRDAPWLAVRR